MLKYNYIGRMHQQRLQAEQRLKPIYKSNRLRSNFDAPGALKPLNAIFFHGNSKAEKVSSDFG